jgi:hypothetical protein
MRRVGPSGFTYWEIGSLDEMRSGISMGNYLEAIWAIHLRKDVCHAIVHSGDPGTRHRDVGIQEIGFPKVKKVRTSEVSKT